MKPADGNNELPISTFLGQLTSRSGAPLSGDVMTLTQTLP